MADLVRAQVDDLDANGRSQPDGPSEVQLEALHWYVCGRKVAHPTHRGAEVAALDVWRHRDNTANPPEVYPCGDHYHVGRPSASRSREHLLRAAMRAYEKYGPR